MLSLNQKFKKASISNKNIWANKVWGGKDWHHHHDHWFRWSGAVFWPYFEGDYFCYGFWPDDCSDVYWGYGPDTLVWGAFWPYGEYYADEPAPNEATMPAAITGFSAFLPRQLASHANSSSPMQAPLRKPAPASHPASAICPFRSSKASSMPPTSSAPRSRI